MKKIIISLLLFTTMIGYSQINAGEYTIKNIEGNSKYSDFGPSYNTSKILIFSSSRKKSNSKWKNGQSFLDLYESIIDLDGEISNIQPLGARVNSQFHESNVSFVPDHTSVFFTRNNAKAEKDNEVKRTNLALYRADVTDKGVWKNIKELPFNSPNYSVGHPTVSRDGKKLYFTSDMPGSYGMTDIFVVDIKKDGTYSRPKNLGKSVNTYGKEMFPFIDKKNHLYFASDSKKDGLGGLDIYAVKVDGKTISKSVHLGEPMNSVSDDFALIIDNNKNQGYFSSNREDGQGDDDIYHFKANKPLQFECVQTLAGTVVDKKGNPINKAIVTVFDDKGKKITSIVTKASGRFRLDAPCNSKLRIVGEKDTYMEDEKEITTGKVAKKHKLKLLLRKVPKCSQVVNLNVEDRATTNAIPMALISIYNKSNKKIFSKKTKETGDLKLQLPCNKNYRITGEKEKYKEDEVNIATGDGNSPQNATLYLQLPIDESEIKRVNNKLIININPIYFRVNSAAITPGATIELNKVVRIMKKYPKLIIEGGSHTDPRGSKSFNQKLSQRRAVSTVNYIISKGIPAFRISAKGYGESQPVNRCVDGVKCSAEEYQLNRRTEFVILNPKDLGL